MHAAQTNVVLCLACVLLLCQPANTSAGIFSTPFGPGGQGGSVNGQILSFGTGGEVFEIQMLLDVVNQNEFDVAGAQFCSSARWLHLESLDEKPSRVYRFSGLIEKRDHQDTGITTCDCESPRIQP